MLTFVGDVQGDFNALVQRLASTPVRDSYFVQVGDFGVGFNEKEREAAQLRVVNDVLKRRNNEMYVVRGNHDDPEYFRKNVDYSNLHFVPDYSVVTLEGLTTLLVGGGISINRRRRVLDDSYWNDEAFLFDEKMFHEAVKGILHIDIVVTHSAPAAFKPTEINPLVFEFAKKDTRLLADLKKDRRLHTKLMKLLTYSKLKPNFWYYGHYHFSHTGEFEGIRYCLLDCLEFVEHKPPND